MTMFMEAARMHMFDYFLQQALSGGLHIKEADMGLPQQPPSQCSSHNTAPQILQKTAGIFT